MIKLTVGQIFEKIDTLCHLEVMLRSGKNLNDVDRENAAELISEYAGMLLGIEVEIRKEET